MGLWKEVSYEEYLALGELGVEAVSADLGHYRDREGYKRPPIPPGTTRMRRIPPFPERVYLARVDGVTDG